MFSIILPWKNKRVKFLWFFSWRYSNIKFSKWTEWLFLWKILLAGFGAKITQNEQKWGFQVFWKDDIHKFSNFFVLGQKGLKCAQNEVFQVLSKASAWHFSDFSMRLQQHQELLMTQMVFFGITLFWGSWTTRSLKCAQTGVFLGAVLRTFVICCIKLQGHRELKLMQMIFWGTILFWIFWSQGVTPGLEMRFFQKLSKVNDFSDFLHEVIAS